MTEIEDILVSGEFAAFREAYAPAVRPCGPAEVRRTVRRRRRRAAVVTAVVVALAVAVPVAANGALHDRRVPTPAVSVEPTPSEPTPSEPTPSSTPSAVPSPTPSTASPTPAGPDGRISRAQLLAARVDLPEWPPYVPKTCTVHNVRLREPQPDYLPELHSDLRYGDLDGDGATETLALVECRIGEAMAKQVVAFDRDDTGRIVTMGQVVGTREGMEDITDFSVQASGQIRVQVADIQPCCSTPKWYARQQWRTYAWTVDRFTQTAGPTMFGPDARLTDLTLTAGDLVLDAADTNGKRTGSVTVTVTNNGPVDVPALGVGNFFTIGEAAGGDASRCRMTRWENGDACVLDGLRAGKSRTYLFRFTVDPGSHERSLTAINYDSQGRYYQDLKPRDDFAVLSLVG